MIDDIYHGMPASALPDSGWHKSRHSNPDGSCVEVAQMPDGRVAMRNSRDKGGPALLYSAEEMTAFVRGVKDGEFDHLIDALAR